MNKKRNIQVNKRTRHYQILGGKPHVAEWQLGTHVPLYRTNYLFLYGSAYPTFGLQRYSIVVKCISLAKPPSNIWTHMVLLVWRKLWVLKCLFRFFVLLTSSVFYFKSPKYGLDHSDFRFSDPTFMHKHVVHRYL